MHIETESLTNRDDNMFIGSVRLKCLSEIPDLKVLTCFANWLYGTLFRNVKYFSGNLYKYGLLFNRPGL